MYLWHVKPLEIALSRGEITEGDGLRYYAAALLISLIATEYSLWWGPRSGWIFYSEGVVLGLILLWGLLRCWAANGGEAGRDILLRIVCLSVPIGIRVNSIAVVVGLLFYNSAHIFLNSETFRDPVRAFEFISYGIFVLFPFLFWHWLAASVHRTAMSETRARET